MTYARLPQTLFCALAITLSAAVGCKDEGASSPATTPAAAANPGLAQGELDHVTFTYPSDWKITRTADGKGVNVSGPSDGDWEPNVFLELQAVQGESALDQQLASNAELLGSRKEDYRHRNTSQGETTAGLKYGRIEYTNTSSEGSVKVPLQQWSVLIPLEEQKRLQVQAAAAAETWSKYQPVFESIINSIANK